MTLTQKAFRITSILGQILLCCIILPVTVLSGEPVKTALDSQEHGFAERYFIQFRQQFYDKIAGADHHAIIQAALFKQKNYFFDQNPDCNLQPTDVIPIGSYIINMGVQPQTAANALKPYGLVWYLLHKEQIPVTWSIKCGKIKDGVDFVYKNKNYTGGPFIIRAEYRSPAVNTLIQTWEAKGVVGVTTTEEVIVPVDRVLQYSMNWTLDHQNGSIAQDYLDRAEIPESAYNWIMPENLNCCSDVFVMPHAHPDWDGHQKLLTWNANEANGGCSGAIWAGCKAGSELENIFNPSNPSQRMNFLMMNPVAPVDHPAVWSGDHDDGTIPPPYSYAHHDHPIMQFLGKLDGSQESGAEQIYMPTNSWRPTTLIGVWDATHPDVPSVSPGPAAKLAFGPAFGDETRGYVVYEAGHRLDRDDKPENIAAQRAFFNFSFMAVGQKAIYVSSNIPGIMETGQSYPLQANITGGSGNYIVKWTSTCAGTFSNPNSATTVFTPSVVSSVTSCFLKVTVTDDCGTRVGYENKPVDVLPAPVPPVAVNDTVITQPGSPVVINLIANDYDLNQDPLTVTGFIGSLNTGNGIFVNNGNGSVTYTSDYDFTGTELLQYIVCDTTPPAKGGPFCDTATIRVYVNWINEYGCFPDEYYTEVLQGDADSVQAENSITNAASALGVPALVSGSNDYYAKIDNNSDYLVLRLEDEIPAGDTIFIYFGTDDGSPGTLQVQGTLTSTNYASGAGFYDLKSYSSSKDLDQSNPLQDTVAYVPESGPVRYLRFTRATDAGKPGLNGVMYSIYDCVSARPVAVDDYVTSCEDNSIAIDVVNNDNDPQGFPLTTSILTNPLHGEADVQQDGTIRYTPDIDYSGVDSFTYKVCNSNDLCSEASVYLHILDDGCPAGQYSTGSSGNIVAVISQTNVSYASKATGIPDNQVAVLSAKQGVMIVDFGKIIAHGTSIQLFMAYHNTNGSSIPTATVTGSVTSNSGFSKSVVFSSLTSTVTSYTYTVSQTGGVRYLKIKADAVAGNENDQFVDVDAATFGGSGCTGNCSFIPSFPPIAEADQEYTVIDSLIIISVLDNDIDPSGHGLTTDLIAAFPPQNGTTSNNSTSIQYIPDAGFVGVDSFAYRTCNINGCDTAWVFVEVRCVNPGTGNGIQGRVFSDENSSGIQESYESGWPGIKVRLYADTDASGTVTAPDWKIDSVLTNSVGTFTFNVPATYGGNGPGGTGSNGMIPLSLVRQVSASSDDAEEGGPDGSRNGVVSLNSSDLEMIHDNWTGVSPEIGPQTQIVGIRFNNITLPPGSVITNAWMEFHADLPDAPNTNSNTANLTIRCQASDNAPTFTTAANNILNRVATSTAASWAPESWTADQLYTTPNLSGIMQEVINRPGWNTGNSIAFIITGSGSRVADAYDENPALAPKLYIEYNGYASDLAQGTAVWAESSNSKANPWNGTAFGSTGNTVSTTERWRIVRGAAAPTRNEKIVAGIGSAGNIYGQICTGSTWENLSINPLGSMAETNRWSVDVAYEQVSGDALLVWNGNPGLKFSVWNGTAWTLPASIPVPLSGEAKHIRLASRPGADEIVAVVSCPLGDYAIVWNGSGWGNAIILDNNAANADFTDVSIAYEYQSGRAMAVYGISTGQTTEYALYYRIWNGFYWSEAAFLQPFPTIDVPSRAKWITLASDPNSNRIVAGVQTAGIDGWVSVWNGASWGTPVLLTPGSLVLDSGTAPNMAVAFESTSGEALAVYGRSSQNVFFHRTWSNGSGWSAEVTAPNVSSNTNTMRLYPNAVTDKIMLALQQDGADLQMLLWSGSAWGAVNTLSSNTSETSNQPFVFLWNQRPAIGGNGSNPGHYVMSIDTTTLPNNSTLITDNIETAVFEEGGMVDCDNNFGFLAHLPPVANPDTVMVDAGTTAYIHAVQNDYDPENTTLDLNILTNPQNGTLTNFSSGTVSYQPNNGYTGTETFQYFVCDQGTPKLCDTTSITVVVAIFTNDPPVAVVDYDTTTVNNEVTTSVVRNDFDQEYGNLSAYLSPGIWQPSHGTISLYTSKKIEYTPNPGFSGNDSYQYIVCDDASPALCDTSTVYIHIKNLAPKAINDYASTASGMAVTMQILANDLEPDGQSFSLQSAGKTIAATGNQSVKNGTLALNDNGTPGIPGDDYITYTPAGGFFGLDTFYYKITDSGSPAASDIAMVVIDVTPLIDLELQKDVSPAVTQVGQNVTFTITLVNKGPSTATEIMVADRLSNSYTFVSDNANGDYDPVSGIWYIPSLAAGDTVTLTITANIVNAASLINVAGVYDVDQADIDSKPNNDDGDQSEDDEDSATPEVVEICGNGLDDDGDGNSDCADTDCQPVSFAGSDASVCPGTTVQLNASASGGIQPYTYSWSHGLGNGASKTVQPVVTTTYTVTVTGAGGCSSTDAVTITMISCPEDCSDGIDNDQDGLIDCNDPDCQAAGMPQLTWDSYQACPGSPLQDQVTFNDSNLQNGMFSIAEQPNSGDVSIDNNGIFNYSPNISACTNDEFVYRVCNTISGCCDTAAVYLLFEDDVPPSLVNVPADITISCEAVVPAPPFVYGIDACPGIFMAYDESSTQVNAGSCQSYTITRTWEATDLCGNTGIATQHINIQDNTIPELFRVYTLANGKKIIGGVSDLNTNLWKTVKFPIVFNTTPIVITQLMTDNEADAVTVRQRNITTESFQLRLQEQESSAGQHIAEKVAWVAVEAGALSDLSKFQAGLLTNVNSTLKTLNFSPAISGTPAFVASMQTTKDNNPAAVRVNSLGGSSVKVMTEEEQSADPETVHNNEDIGYIAVRTGNIYDTDSSFVAEAGVATISSSWSTVNLTRRYNKPVVIFGGLPTDGTPATIRVKNVTANSFQVKIKNWDYLPAAHNSLAASYIVVEGGIPATSAYFCDSSAVQIVAGVNLFATDNCDNQLSFEYDEHSNASPFGLLVDRSWTAIDDCGNYMVFSRVDTCPVATVKIKALLSGPLVNSGSDLLRDDLRTSGYMPLIEPYTGMTHFHHKGLGGLDSIPQSMLQITGADAIVDWVFVEIRDTIAAAPVLATRSLLLQRDGDVVTPLGNPLIAFQELSNGWYKVAIRHRNHLGIMKEAKVLLQPDAPLVDFTSTSTVIHSAQDGGKIMPNGKRALWSGDFNGDRKVVFQGPINDIFELFSYVLSDPNNVSNLANFITTGYHSSDINLDGKVIYQGPNNDRSLLLYQTILSHPGNITNLANFIAVERIP